MIIIIIIIIITIIIVVIIIILYKLTNKLGLVENKLNNSKLLSFLAVKDSGVL